MRGFRRARHLSQRTPGQPWSLHDADLFSCSSSPSLCHWADTHAFLMKSSIVAHSDVHAGKSTSSTAQHSCFACLPHCSCLAAHVQVMKFIIITKQSMVMGMSTDMRSCVLELLCALLGTRYQPVMYDRQPPQKGHIARLRSVRQQSAPAAQLLPSSEASIDSYTRSYTRMSRSECLQTRTLKWLVLYSSCTRGPCDFAGQQLPLRSSGCTCFWSCASCLVSKVQDRNFGCSRAQLGCGSDCVGSLPVGSTNIQPGVQTAD